MVSSSSHIVTSQTGVQLAEQRLGRALKALEAAQHDEDQRDESVARHGGPNACSVWLIERLMRSHERAFIAQAEVDRAERLWCSALADEITNGGTG